jgi:hypothetical protein
MSVSGHSGVVEAAGVAAAAPEAAVAAGDVVAGLDEVHPAVTNARQRPRRRIYQTPEIFIDPFLGGEN